MRNLRFLEIGRHPERRGIDQREQLLARRDIGAGAGVDVGQVSVDRRNDCGEPEVELRILHRGLRRFHIGLGRLKGLHLIVILLAADHIFCEEIHGAFGVGFEVDELGLRLRKLTLGLIERGLESARVDLEKQIAFLDRLVVFHRNLHDGPGYAGRDADHIGPHVGIASPRFGQVTFIHEQRGDEGQRNDAQGNENLGLHGAKRRPSTDPQSTVKAMKKSGRFQMWRVRRNRSSTPTISHAKKKPKAPMTMPHGSMKSPKTISGTRREKSTVCHCPVSLTRGKPAAV